MIQRPKYCHNEVIISSLQGIIALQGIIDALQDNTCDPLFIGFMVRYNFGLG